VGRVSLPAVGGAQVVGLIDDDDTPGQRRHAVICRRRAQSGRWGVSTAHRSRRAACHDQRAPSPGPVQPLQRMPATPPGAGRAPLPPPATGAAAAATGGGAAAAAAVAPGACGASGAAPGACGGCWLLPLPRPLPLPLPGLLPRPWPLPRPPWLLPAATGGALPASSAAPAGCGAAAAAACGAGGGAPGCFMCLLATPCSFWQAVHVRRFIIS
jgi:hypothetical protein